MKELKARILSLKVVGKQNDEFVFKTFEKHEPTEFCAMFIVE